MSDVGAVVLTLGEATTRRAIASVRAQSLPIGEIAVVDGVSPFHCALNMGAARVQTPFFLQVDADFVLDRHCASVLRQAMAPDVGITVGALRDPLIGRIAGVKLFRRECFDSVGLGDSVAPEVDFCRDLERIGWQTRYVVATDERTTGALGDHRPGYTLGYVFGTYYLLGSRYASREDVVGLMWRLSELRSSKHLMAPVARVAMSHGIFAGEARDAPKPVPAVDQEPFLRKLASRSRAALHRPRGAHLRPGGDLIDAIRRHNPLSVFDAFRELGGSLRTGSEAGFHLWLATLAESPDPRSWVAEVGLCHGALAESATPIPRAAMATLERLDAPFSALFPRPS